MSISTLPQELIDVIIDHLHGDIRTLKRCSVVCTAWTPSSQFHIFRVCSSPTFASTWRLFRLLQNAPHLTHHVRSLALSDVEDWFAGKEKSIVGLDPASRRDPVSHFFEKDKVLSGIPLLPKLSILEVRRYRSKKHLTPVNEPILSLIRSLCGPYSEVSIIDCTFQIADLFTAILACPRLTSLRHHRVRSLDYNVHDWIPDVAKAMSTARSSESTVLDSLELHGNDISFALFFSNICLSKFITITSLTYLSCGILEAAILLPHCGETLKSFRLVQRSGLDPHNIGANPNDPTALTLKYASSLHTVSFALDGVYRDNVFPWIHSLLETLLPPSSIEVVQIACVECNFDDDDMLALRELDTFATRSDTPLPSLRTVHMILSKCSFPASAHAEEPGWWMEFMPQMDRKGILAVR